jgi:hypothetical protein
MAAIHPLRTSPKKLHQLISNWLALAVLLLLGVVWPPVFASGVTNTASDGAGAMGDSGVLLAPTDTHGVFPRSGDQVGVGSGRYEMQRVIESRA